MGVIYLFLENIPGTDLTVNCLKKLGKKIVFVSNNSTKTLKFYQNQLQAAGCNVEDDEIITPMMSIAAYLKKINVSKQVYVLGTPALKSYLEKSGFRIAEDPPNHVEENVGEFVKQSIGDRGKIGAVVSDADLNLTYVKLQRAAYYLRDPDIPFIVGATDDKLPVGKAIIFIGPGYFHKILEDITGRKGYKMAKPSPHFNEYIVEKLQIKDMSRVLFVGDSIPEDMGFATNAGYRKLLVLSGATKAKDVEHWTFPEAFKPDFYIDNFGSLHELIWEVYGNKL